MIAYRQKGPKNYLQLNDLMLCLIKSSFKYNFSWIYRYSLFLFINFLIKKLFYLKKNVIYLWYLTEHKKWNVLYEYTVLFSTICLQFNCKTVLMCELTYFEQCFHHFISYFICPILHSSNSLVFLNTLISFLHILNICKNHFL